MIIFFLLISFPSFAQEGYLHSLWNGFIIHEFKHIKKWECPTLEKGKCVDPCTVLKTKNSYEFNCLGVTIKHNEGFYKHFFKIIAQKDPSRNQLVCVHPFDSYVKNHYFSKYFLYWKSKRLCTRLMLFDINVLSGRSIAKKIEKTSYGNGITKLKQIKYNYMSYLRKIKNFKHYGKGWTNRVNDAYNKSKEFCDKK